MKRPALKNVLLAVGLTLAVVAYVGSYLSRSVQGRYEPEVIGLNGVKWYAWAPKGFVTDFKWDRRLMLVYLPLHYADRRFWHTWDAAYDGRYPVNEVPVEEIGKVYRAWK